MADSREPFQQTAHAAAPLTLGMNQFGQLKQIGQAPLTIVEAEQPLIQGFAGGQFAEHTHEPVIPPQILVTVKAHHIRLPVTLGRGQRMQQGAVTAHQISQQGSPHQRLSPGLNDRNQ